jgi:hypothetical protein
LLALGFSHLQATILISLTNALFISGGLILQQYLDVLMAGIIIFGVALILSILLEFVLHIAKKIQPDDPNQTLLFPSIKLHTFNQ